MNNRLKKGGAALLAAALCISCAACSGGNSKKSSEYTTIVVGNWPTESSMEEREVYDGYVKKLQEEYPNIIVKGEEYGYSPDTFLPKAAAKQLPNLYTTFFSEPQNIIKSGYARDITEYAEKYGYLDALNDNLVDIVSRDGKCYGIPYLAYVMGMWYNVELFKEAGLVDKDGVPIYPDTYDELVDTAVQIKKKTGKAGFVMPTRDKIGGWFFLNLAWSFGAEFEKQDGDGKWRACFNSEECERALKYIKDLKWKYDVLPENNLVGIDDVFKYVGTYQAAMSYGMDAHKDAPVMNYKMNKDDLSMGPVPQGPGGRCTQVGGATWMVSNVTDDKQTDAIFKWLEIAGYSPKVTEETKKASEEKLRAKQKDGLSIITPMQQYSIWKSEEVNKQIDDLQKKYCNVKPELWKGINADNLIIKPEEPVNCQELYALLDVAIQKVLLDKNADSKAILAEMNDKFQKTYLDKIK